MCMGAWLKVTLTQPQAEIHLCPSHHCPSLPVSWCCQSACWERTAGLCCLNDTWQPSLSSFALPHDRELSGSTSTLASGKENIPKSTFLKILLSPLFLKFY